MNEHDSLEPIIAPWPSHWPGRQFVDFGNIGDPGNWIDTRIPNAEELLSGVSDDQEMASNLAEEYIAAALDSGFPLPTDFGMDEERMREIATEDFVGFIREWRKRTEAEREKAKK